jgi:hypothetical protein
MQILEPVEEHRFLGPLATLQGFAGHCHSMLGGHGTFIVGIDIKYGSIAQRVTQNLIISFQHLDRQLLSHISQRHHTYAGW